jgi:hypothetical protein
LKAVGLTCEGIHRFFDAARARGAGLSPCRGSLRPSPSPCRHPHGGCRGRGGRSHCDDETEALVDVVELHAGIGQAICGSEEPVEGYAAATQNGAGRVCDLDERIDQLDDLGAAGGGLGSGGTPHPLHPASLMPSKVLATAGARRGTAAPGGTLRMPDVGRDGRVGCSRRSNAAILGLAGGGVLASGELAASLKSTTDAVAVPIPLERRTGPRRLAPALSCANGASNGCPDANRGFLFACRGRSAQLATVRFSPARKFRQL